jgi:glutathione synthase/RimK-type ligase-like ATP-grasp enzyme
MRKKGVYLWCSGPTDQTGELLADKLKISWGTKRPDLKNLLLLIGWGTKTKDKVNLRKIPVINHPDRIHENRNKLNALQIMMKADIKVPNFVSASVILKELKKGKDQVVKLPVVGRTEFHQGGKGLWICPTIGQVRSAINEGARYFQNMIDIDKEYRVHVIGDEVIYVAKKVQRSKEEMRAAFVRKEFERQKTLAEKNNDPFDEAGVKRVLERQASRMVVDHLVRSNTRGWKFSHVTKYDKNLAAMSLSAVEALGLEFGAVDCCIDADNRVWIIEVNTGPGLEGSSFEAYINKFTKMIDNILNPKSADTAIEAMLQDKPIKTHKKPTKNVNLRTDMTSKAATMSEMIEKANDDQLVVLKNVFSKMFD